MNRKRFLQSIFAGGIGLFMPTYTLSKEDKTKFDGWDSSMGDATMSVSSESLTLPPREGIDVCSDVVTFIQPDYLNGIGDRYDFEYIISLEVEGLVGDDRVGVQVDGVDINHNHVRQDVIFDKNRTKLDFDFCFAEEKCQTWHLLDDDIFHGMKYKDYLLSGRVDLTEVQYLTHYGKRTLHNKGHQIAVVKITQQASPGDNKRLYVIPKITVPIEIVAVGDVEKFEQGFLKYSISEG